MRFLLLCLLASTTVLHAADRPNVVFILLDNVGREWFGCYGSAENCTPNIDRIAQSGVRFANCYTTTVCGPSRVELLTGRYPGRTGWYLHHDAALYSGGGFDPKREVTIARVLRDAGYATGIAGKWQVNNLYDEHDAITQHGFQEQLVWPGSIDRDKADAAFNKSFQEAITGRDATFLTEATRKIESRYWDAVLLRNGKRERHEGKFGPDLMQQFAFEFLERHRSKPFFLYYPMLLTHGQSAAEPVVFTPDNRDAPPADEHAKFAGMLRYADKLVGRFFAELDRLGLRENTIVFVASDNGTEKTLSAAANGRVVQGGLYQINEAGGNVPLMVNCPAMISGGRTAVLSDFTDILPTICDLTHTPKPKHVKLDGQSFARFLYGNGDAPRTWIFNEYGPDRVARDERFKLTNKGQLFDIEHDPDEKQPLSTLDADASAAQVKLKAVLDSMPAQTPLPFEHRSLSAFKLKTQAAAAMPELATFVTTWGKEGDAPGDFNIPIGIAINAKDEVFVTDHYNSRVQKFDANGKLLALFAVLPNPGGIAVDGDRLYLTHFPASRLRKDKTPDRVSVYSQDGTFIREWGSSGDGDGQLNFPGGIVVSKQGEVFVSDETNRRVQVFDREGKFLRKWGEYGVKPGQFGGNTNPKSRVGGPNFLVFDRDGSLFTTEASMGRVQSFDLNGKPQLAWGTLEDKPGGFGGAFTGFKASLVGCIGICFDHSNRAWVTAVSGRVQCFTREGKFLGGIVSQQGTKPGEFYAPHGIAVNSRDELFVVDSYNHRVQKFRVMEKGK